MNQTEQKNNGANIPGCMRRLSNGEGLWLWSPPANVAMAARIIGDVSEKDLRRAINAVRRMHPLIGAKVNFDGHHDAWLSTDNVPETVIRTVPRTSETQWFEEIRHEHRIPFRARVRYFDDIVKKSVDEGLEQLVILGAGYDTRAYRIEGLNGKGNIKVFEVDHPVTQEVKTEKIKEIFGELPEHVAYVPIDLMTENLGEELLGSGYDKSKQTLFLMEGLLMYLQPKAVDGILSFIVKNSGKGSMIIFDYYPQSVVDGSSELEVGRITHDYLAQIGEPLLFGINEGMVEEFLIKRGFFHVCNATSEDYKMTYFHGANKDRPVCSLMSFAHAVVE